MKLILDTIEFLQSVRNQMRFGEFSRLPIRLHRFEITCDSAECDWFMRMPDPWDVHLPPAVQQEHLTSQALLDALKIRELIFRGFPEIQQAGLRMYREQEGAAPELMMIGEVERKDHDQSNVASPAMRARLYGFRFSLAGGVLERLAPN
jgi:hypothetical protein